MIFPYVLPFAVHSRPSGNTSATQLSKYAPRFSSGTPASFCNSSALFAASSPCTPAKRALYTPGAPPSASTHSPESSAKADRPSALHTVRALMSAFSAKVAPVSSMSPANPASCMERIAKPVKISAISRSLPLLPLATTIVCIGSPPSPARGSKYARGEISFVCGLSAKRLRQDMPRRHIDLVPLLAGEAGVRARCNV